MSDETPRLRLAQLVSLQELNTVTWNEALAQLDALADLCLLGQFVDTPPANPADGDAYLIGGAPSGAWSGYAYKIASCLDGAWRFYTPFNGLRAYVTTTGAFIVYCNGVWSDWNSLISANEVSLASAATCDLGAANALFVQITGTTTITSFGSGANKLRFVRFAQALSLTHNATSLILLGGASRITAAGDVALYASDANGNWRERSYVHAADQTPFLSVDLGGSDQTGLAAATGNKIAFSNVVKDTANGWDATNKRYTPKQAGLYLVTLCVRLTGTGMASTANADIFKNGNVVAGGAFIGGLNNATYASSSVSKMIDMNGTTDYIEGWCYVPAGGTAFDGNSYNTYLQIVRIR